MLLVTETSAAEAKSALLGCLWERMTYFAPTSTAEATERKGLTETREEPTLYPSI